MVGIGADEGKFRRSRIAVRFQRWTRLFGLGFDVDDDDVEVPAYTGRVGIASASPAGAR